MTFEVDLPFEWEHDSTSSDINTHRNISIVRYETQYPFDSVQINHFFKRNILKMGYNFGCIDVKNNNDTIHLLFARMGDKRHTSAIFDSETRFYSSRSSFRIKNIIASTTHVDNFPDENNKLNLLVFNGGSIQKETLFSQYRYFLSKSLPKQLDFNETELRKLCFDKFHDKLLDISFNPVKEPGFGNTQQAQYKSEPDNILNPNAEKIKELKEKGNIIITSFRSYVTSTHDDLSKEYDVKFTIHSNGKIELEFPKLVWIDLDFEEIEMKFYEFARKIYDEIVSKELYTSSKHPATRNLTIADF